jgi:hypothetical protein
MPVSAYARILRCPDEPIISMVHHGIAQRAEVGKIQCGLGNKPSAERPSVVNPLARSTERLLEAVA